ncbi:MAG: thermonuclease family protein [Clostridia bacterium]|nr:thermonuclease family protein [Clostridia bacterium]
MNIRVKCLSILLSLLLLLSGVSALAEAPAESSEYVDYAGQLGLNITSETVKAEVTVKTFIDGDTVHFYARGVTENGVLKARFLAVNTPETTGKIEEYGKAAAAYTRSALENAVSIIVESDNGAWNLDSTGDRYLVWVWYQPEEGAAYRCLNLELLQNGLCIANSTANNRYGSTCMAALNQARALKLNVHSGKPDPDFYYGDAVELTLRELRTNLEAYNGIKVAFNGVVTMNSSNAVYVESFDPESGLYYGMSVYYGFGLSGKGLSILNVGNEVRIVGTVQYYEAGGTWQVSGLTYRMMKPKDPGNIQLLSEGHHPAYVLTDAATFANGTVTLKDEDSERAFPYAELAVATSIEMRGLVVKDVYTTDNEDSSSNGAMTLTCEQNGVTVYVRTAVLTDTQGNLVTADAFLGKTIDVRGVVDFFDGHHQVKVLTYNNITIHD